MKLHTFWSDPDRVVQVVGNLLSNAVKYTPDGGRIAIVAEEGDGEITISVRDSGAGIPAEDLPYHFDRFWHALRSSRAGGTGLGLSIAKGIVEGHGGRVWVKSAVSRGTTFTFTLPTDGPDLPVTP